MLRIARADVDAAGLGHQTTFRVANIMEDELPGRT
jgi:hypothetical protein